MGIGKPGATEYRQLVDLLSQEWEDVEDLAKAVMEKSYAVYASKAKFAVIGQTVRADNPAFKGTPRRGFVLDVFRTQKQADDEALKLTSSRANPTEPQATWVVPMFGGTAHAYHSSRKAERSEANRGATSADRLSALIRSQESVPRCPHVDLDDDLNFVQCVHYAYHEYDHHYSTEGLPPCQRQVLIPGEHHVMAHCSLHQYHYGHCVAQAHFQEEEEHEA